MEASHFPSDSGPGWELIVQATESPCPWWQFEVFFFFSGILVTPILLYYQRR